MIPKYLFLTFLLLSIALVSAAPVQNENSETVDETMTDAQTFDDASPLETPEQTVDSRSVGSTDTEKNIENEATANDETDTETETMVVENNPIESRAGILDVMTGAVESAVDAALGTVETAVNVAMGAVDSAMTVVTNTVNGTLNVLKPPFLNGNKPVKRPILPPAIIVGRPPQGRPGVVVPVISGPGNYVIGTIVPVQPTSNTITQKQSVEEKETAEAETDVVVNEEAPAIENAEEQQRMALDSSDSVITSNIHAESVPYTSPVIGEENISETNGWTNVEEEASGNTPAKVALAEEMKNENNQTMDSIPVVVESSINVEERVSTMVKRNVAETSANTNEEDVPTVEGESNTTNEENTHVESTDETFASIYANIF